MSFSIDVVYLDREYRIVKVVDALPPWRLSFGGLRSRHTMEMPAGEAMRQGLVPGLQLSIDPA